MSDKEQRTKDEVVASPVMRSFSEAELHLIARKWMVREEGSPLELDGERRDTWYERLGLLTHFVSDLWEWRDPT